PPPPPPAAPAAPVAPAWAPPAAPASAAPVWAPPTPPAPAGATPVAVPEQPLGASDPFEEFFAGDDELEATVVVVRGSVATEWNLIDVDGTAFPLHRSNVLGRRPKADGASDDAQLVALSDPSRVLSRSHALVEIDKDELWVTDLGSTNGTDVLDSQGAITECAPRSPRLITADQRLSLGGREVSFSRSAR
ncbi:MAG: FHA domain-containing protein, partial [Actinobacteria bacterium]|nr:FHA domain-containing protein [Actinomycetota bacterium]